MIVSVLALLLFVFKGCLVFGGCGLIALCTLFPINDRPTSRGQMVWCGVCITVFLTLVFAVSTGAIVLTK